MRLAFYTGFGDSFTDQVATDVASALSGTDHEYFHITAYRSAHASPHVISEDALLMCTSPGTLDTASGMHLPHCHNETHLLNHVRDSDTLGARLLLKMLQPDAVMVWNGLLNRRGSFARAAQGLGIPVLFVEKGLFANSWVVDPQGVNAGSFYTQHANTYRATDDEIHNLQDRIQTGIQQGQSAWGQPPRCDPVELKRRLAIPERNRIIFFPGQVDDDSNIRLYSQLFRCVKDALDWVLRGIRDDTSVLFKPHPKATTRISRKDFINAKQCIMVPNVNVWDLIAISDAVITINSTVGVEAALTGKRVHFLGQSILSSLPMCAPPEANAHPGQVIDSLLNRTNREVELCSQDITSFIAHVHAKHYSYKGDLSRTLDLIARWLPKSVLPKQKLFNKDEISLLMPEPSSQALSERLHAYDSLCVLWLKAGREIQRVFRQHRNLA